MTTQFMNASYSVVSKVIHWLTALIVLGLLAVGFYMTSLDFSEDKLQLYALHKSFGLLVLTLVAVRVVWHLFKKKPKPLPTHARWEVALAHGAHAFLYVALFILPLSGWIMSSAGDFTIQFFGLDVPDITSKDEGLFKSSRQVHEWMAITLALVVGLHMAGAFKHHFLDKDQTLQRMSVARLGAGGGAALLIVFGGLYLLGAVPAVEELYEELAVKEADHEQNVKTSPQEQEMRNSSAGHETAYQDTTGDSFSKPEGVTQWIIDPDGSTLTFKATQYSQEFEGTFAQFNGDIFFDADDLAHSVVRITIHTPSIKTGSDDRDEQALSEEWFNTQKYPVATFEAQDFVAQGDNKFVANGDLTIRGHAQSIALPFSLDFEAIQDGKRRADMKGSVTLNRLDFGVGQGQWKSTDAIGGKVDVIVDVTAYEKE